MDFLFWRSWLNRARRAARDGRWAAAAAAYHRHLAHNPSDVAARIQLGHNLKEAGEPEAAAEAYRHALAMRPGDENLAVHLAYLERLLGRREAAIAVLLAAIAASGAEAGPAIRALIDMGARERLPLTAQRTIEIEAGDYAPSRHAVWRAARRMADAVLPSGVRLLAAIDGASSAEVTRATLAGTPCRILAADRLPDTPIGAVLGDATHVLLVEAGARLAPDAVARLAAALAATGAGAAYTDHDHWSEAAGGGIAFADPCLQPMFDPLWFWRGAARPPCLLLTAEAAALAGTATAGTWGNLAARRMALPVRYAHVPLLLASRWAGAVPPDAAPLPAPAGDADPIQIVIQTRDAPGLLAACVESLRATALRPELLDIVIVDNRSVLPETAALLEGWAVDGIARILPHDEAFNWARANNLAAGEGRAPLLLFLNNDVEMETEGWDEALRAGLAGEGAGVLGALLLYPDRTIQHAGVIFGMGVHGSPVHEGVGHPTEPGGPAARWRHPRRAAAVTGAWMAVPRALFEAVGGFEERLPIAYNDIDFCLRVRARGRAVVQASDIVAIHRESATRGAAMSLAEVARDQADWAWLRTRWGAGLDLDPAYNPNWSRTGQPFDGLHHAAPEAIERWIKASAAADPWGGAAQLQRREGGRPGDARIERRAGDGGERAVRAVRIE